MQALRASTSSCGASSRSRRTRRTGSRNRAFAKPSRGSSTASGRSSSGTGAQCNATRRIGHPPAERSVGPALERIEPGPTWPSGAIRAGGDSRTAVGWTVRGIAGQIEVAGVRTDRSGETTSGSPGGDDETWGQYCAGRDRSGAAAPVKPRLSQPRHLPAHSSPDTFPDPERALGSSERTARDRWEICCRIAFSAPTVAGSSRGSAMDSRSSGGLPTREPCCGRTPCE